MKSLAVLESQIPTTSSESLWNGDRETASNLLALLISESNTLLEPVAEDKILSTRAKQLDQILKHVSRRLPIPMVILGFPAKSPNRKKTFSDLPDLGEIEGLKRLNYLAHQMRLHYAPGAHIRICSDGHVFTDIVRVSDEKIRTYQTAIEKIIYDFELTNLSTFSMSDLYQGLTYDGMRERLLKEFGLALSHYHESVKNDFETKILFNGMHRFLFEDYSEVGTWSRTQARNAAKVSTYELMQRSQAFGQLIASTFPDAVRLSIHPQLAASSKIGVKLVPGGNHWATPWHNVLVVDSYRRVLMHRSQAESLGAKLKWFDDSYAYYDLTEK